MAQLVASHFDSKPKSLNEEKDRVFWDGLGMTGFSSWLQKGLKTDYYLHCVETLDGISLEEVLVRLRLKILEGDPIACSMHQFYLEAFEKDYLDPTSMPQTELVVDLNYPPAIEVPEQITKRAFVYPILKEKEKAHREYCKRITGDLADVHHQACENCGVHKIKKWFQKTPEGLFVVVCTEGIYQEKLDKENKAWGQISEILMDHTGLAYEELHAHLTPLILSSAAKHHTRQLRIDGL